MRLTSKKLLIVILIVAMGMVGVSVLLAGGKQEAPKPAAGEEMEGFSWTRYSGSRIVVNFPTELAYNCLVELLPEFEALTGIKVDTDIIAYMNLREAQMLQMNKPVNDYDVTAFVCMWKTEYVDSNMLAELEPMFDDQKLAMPNYDFADLVPAYVDVSGRVGGPSIYAGGPGSKLYGIPLSSETSILGYRKDLQAKYGFQVPDTYDELRKQMKAIAENEKGKVYGLTMRGQVGHQATAGWLTHADPFGAKVFDDKWNPTFNNQYSIETLEFLQEVVKYGPPGIPSFAVGAADDAFLQGIAAFFIDHDRVAGMSRDPNQSKIIETAGFALHPKHRTRKSETGGYGIGIPSNSANKEAAFLFIQWATSKEITKKIAVCGGTPNRMSSYSDNDLLAKYPDYKVIGEQLKYADPNWRPLIKEWTEINVDLLGVAINQVLTGAKQPQEAMNAIVEPVRAIMEKGGYYKK